LNSLLLDQIVNAVLYEGYILYPYRASSAKNQRGRFTFGRVYPRLYSQAQGGVEPWFIQTECLLHAGTGPASLHVRVRFLQPTWREVGVLPAPVKEWPGSGEPAFEIVPELRLNGVLYQTWQEALEREVNLPEITPPPASHLHVPFAFAASRSVEPLRDEHDLVRAVLVRQAEAMGGAIDLEVSRLADNTLKITVRVTNESPIGPANCENENAVINRTFASTHAILNADGAEFVSLLDPPAEWKEAAAQCKNIGTWPVLIGDESKRECHIMLSSPIILYDYPRIAPQSPGDLFDGTEIDEILTLRILTMTDEEKREMRHVDAHARRLLERTERLDQRDVLNLHGQLRARQPFDELIFGTGTPLEQVFLNGTCLSRGARVRIRPKKRADVMDLALSGRTAVVAAVEQDAEQEIHLALVLEDDPGKDLGMLHQTGHRFFYGLEEVEPLKDES
jgi:hydrogenase maturation protease